MTRSDSVSYTHLDVYKRQAQKYPLEKVVLIILQSQRGEAFLLHKFALKSELGELIGVATAKKDGLMPMEPVSYTHLWSIRKAPAIL